MNGKLYFYFTIRKSVGGILSLKNQHLSILEGEQKFTSGSPQQRRGRVNAFSEE